MQSLVKWDRLILKQINVEWHNSFFDWFLPFLRNSDMWAPLYFFLLLFGLINFKKTAWRWVIAAVITAALSDYISSDIIKPNLFRLRPCNDPAIADWIRTLPGIYLPQSSSFTSSHATNHFAIATYLYITLRKLSPYWGLAFLWAALISYAQVYVGVHYPFDVFGGAVLGSILGLVFARVFDHQIGLGLAT